VTLDNASAPTKAVVPANITPGTYTFEYRIYDAVLPSVYITKTFKVIVECRMTSISLGALGFISPF